MENKKIALYIAIGIILLLLILSSFDIIRFEKSNSGSNNAVNSNIPEECQKPEGQDIESWKEHLSHHQNTLYCLDYYK